MKTKASDIAIALLLALVGLPLVFFFGNLKLEAVARDFPKAIFDVIEPREMIG